MTHATNNVDDEDGDGEDDAHSHGFSWWHLLVAAIFMASLLHLSTVKWLLTPLEVPTLATFNLASHLARPSASLQDPVSVVAVLIDRSRYETKYAGTSPLPRQALSEDLGYLLSRPGVKHIVLDLDVSPSARAHVDKAFDTEEKALHALLKRNATSLTLIAPRTVTNPELQSRRAAWLIEMCRAGVAIADPRLHPTLGMVTRSMAYDALTVGVGLRAGAGARGDLGNLCPSIGGSEELARALVNPDSGSTTLDQLGEQVTKRYRPNGKCVSSPCPDTQARILPFHKSLHLTRVAHWCPDTLPTQVPAPRIRLDCASQEDVGQEIDWRNTSVVFGSGSDPADQFITPLGVRSGAEVHAMAASAAPVNENSLVSFLMDVLFGVLFGALAHHCWHVWFDARRDQGNLIGLIPLKSHNAWLALVALTLGLAMAAIGGVAIAAYALHQSDLWVSPVPVLVGMTIDGFVTAGVQSAPLTPASAKESLILSLRRLGQGLGGDLWSLLHVFLYAVPKVIYLTVVIAAALHLAH
ncbi:MAG: hypothetical protein KF871_13635 [Hydrogenophaga sp.]|uniref:CHASE2 domain-containing protein n=1 Tax=Hydrogenophaga sp. TaxID=1904254 RepID=UPI001D4B35B8|nr:CHASE2 domain-containing protein [Hydrogenophaga sp.]MBX3610927.1 hypothetical protein [Hydrogenophaga sp.]